MFKKISIQLALLFTAFVVLLLLLNGAIFLTADIRSVQQSNDGRLLHEGQHILTDLEGMPPDLWSSAISPRSRDRARILDAQGHIVYSSELLAPVLFVDDGIPFHDQDIQGEEYRILTAPIVQAGRPDGFFQIADRTAMDITDLPNRIGRFLYVSALISLLTFFIGLYFAKRSLRPAEETMQRLEQFTQDASHELRTPLTILGSSIDLALKTQNYREGLVSAKDDLKRLSSLTERLLELARIEKLALIKRRVDLSNLVGNSLEQFHLLAEEKDISLKSSLIPGVTVLGDDALLHHLVGNLLSNAIKYTPKNGAVTVTLTKQSFRISDTGIGISQEDIPHIFDRFYRADHSRGSEGYGLGLALVKRIADMHYWHITVESKEGSGTQFTVAFHAEKTKEKKSAA